MQAVKKEKPQNLYLLNMTKARRKKNNPPQQIIQPKAYQKLPNPLKSHLN
jgi:hypothetical protein